MTGCPWDGVGAEAGVDVWRMERNNVVPVKEVGVFYEGDAYIVLHTFTYPGSDTLHYSIHYWLGFQTSQEAWTSVAAKTVELDDFLGGKPVQHREMQGYETESFLELFPTFTLRKGAIDESRPARAEKVRLLRVAGKFNRTQLHEFPVDLKHLNSHDVFILDAGKQIFQYNGRNTNAWVKRKGCEVLENMQDARKLPHSAVHTVAGTEDECPQFWMFFGGIKDVTDSPRDNVVVSKDGEAKVFGISKDMQRLTEPRLATFEALHPSTALLVDTTYSLFIWGGFDVDAAALKRSYLKICETYLADHPTRSMRSTPVVYCTQGNEPDEFVELFPPSS